VTDPGRLPHVQVARQSRAVWFGLLAIALLALATRRPPLQLLAGCVLLATFVRDRATLVVTHDRVAAGIGPFHVKFPRSDVVAAEPVDIPSWPTRMKRALSATPDAGGLLWREASVWSNRAGLGLLIRRKNAAPVVVACDLPEKAIAALFDGR